MKSELKGEGTYNVVVIGAGTAGFARVLLAKRSDKILGASLACDHAGDLLQEFVLAMRHRIGLSGIA